MTDPARYMKTLQTQTEAANAKNEGGASLSEVRATRKEFYALPVVSRFSDLNNSYTGLQSTYDQYKSGTIDKGIVDQGLTIMFNKMLDPGSVVREGEYARTAAGQAAITRAQEAVKQLSGGGGGISDKTREDMVNLAKTLYNGGQQEFNRQAKFYVDYADELGTTPEALLGSYYQYYTGNSGGGTSQSDIDFYNSL